MVTLLRKVIYNIVYELFVFIIVNCCIIEIGKSIGVTYNEHSIAII